jgi:predicted Fe-Mo cluster-binding NifX family protein
MKIAFTTSGNDLTAPLEARFGRASRFLIYNLEDDTFEVIDNEEGMNASQGSGIQAAQTLAKLEVKALVTGHCGPKAFRVLQAAGIKVYNTPVCTIAEALTQFRAGELAELRAADVDSHWT